MADRGTGRVALNVKPLCNVFASGEIPWSLLLFLMGEDSGGENANDKDAMEAKEPEEEEVGVLIWFVVMEWRLRAIFVSGS